MTHDKKCSKCGLTQPTANFGADRAKRDGLTSQCRQCRVEYRVANRKRITEHQRQHYAANQERLTEQRRAFYAANRERSIEQAHAYQQTLKGRATRNASVNKWRANNPERLGAQREFRNAMRRGEITRQPCIVCGDPNAHGHHVVYSLPLAVSWLCSQHHMQAHALHRGIERRRMAQEARRSEG